MSVPDSCVEYVRLIDYLNSGSAPTLPPFDKADLESFSSFSNSDQTDNPRIFFADEPRPSIWHILSPETRIAIEAFAHGDIDAGDALARDDIAVELAHDTAAGWHDTNPIVRVCIDGNEWNLEFEERSASEDSSGNEDDSVGEATENEDGSREEAALERHLSIVRRDIEPRRRDIVTRLSTLHWSMQEAFEDEKLKPEYMKTLTLLTETLIWMEDYNYTVPSVL